MKIAHFFIDRPVFAIVLSLVAIIAGSIAVFTLPIAQYPQIAPPTVTVSATYPGANAETVAKTVATPLEEQINGVENMLYMSSQSTNTGNLNLTVTFKVGTNLDVAQVQVQNRVAIAQPQLPPEVQQEGIIVKKASPDITLAIAFFSPDTSHDALFLSNYVTLQVKDQIARLPGVGDINLFGVRDYSMRLWLNPDEMAARSMTAGDVVNAVREQNIQVAAGVVGGPPLPKESSAFQYTLNAQGRLTDPSEFGDIVVKVGADGRITRLKEIGRVELGAADYGTTVDYNGHPSVALAVFQLPGTNAIDTANVIYAKMKELKKHFPPGVDYAVAHDTTPFVRESITDLIHTLLIAISLVALVVLVFLQSWRASLVPILAIPVSLVGTFAAMWLVGFSLNMLTLFGLVLAIGIVVDDAIVVVENVQRWLDEGAEPARCGVQGDGRGYPRRHRDRFRSLGGIYSGRLHSGYHRAVLSAVRADDCVLDSALGFHLADSQSCPVGAAAEAPRRQTGLAYEGARPRAWMVFPAVQQGLRADQPVVHQVAALRSPLWSHHSDRLRGIGLSGLRHVQNRAYRFHPDAGPGLSHRKRSDAGRVVDRADRRSDDATG